VWFAGPFEALLTVGHDQADLGQGEYNGSIEWRMSRVSIIESRIAAVVTLPRIPGASSHSETETEDEVVNMELAFRRPDPKTKVDGRRFTVADQTIDTVQEPFAKLGDESGAVERGL
jgi:hypothetical protein